MKLEIKGLKKSYGTHTALEPLNLTVSDCQALVLLGPSGSGKSTLLRLIAGLQYPDEGSIVIDDEPIIFEEKQLLKHRRKLGVVFQSWNLFPHLTALENIVLPLHHVQGLSLEEAEQRGFELLKRFELDSHAHKKPYTLSGGQAQRVAIIRAVAGHPKMLLMDEPTSALDPFMTYEVLELILELKREEHNLILATHHFSFAKKLADHALFLADGKLQETGAADEVFERPHSALAKRYLKTILSY